MIWDPKGCHIGAGRGQEAAGKQFKHVGSDLPVRFADQFAVWDFGQGVSTASPDTLIRVPLRTEVQSALITMAQAKTPLAPLPCQLRPPDTCQSDRTGLLAIGCTLQDQHDAALCGHAQDESDFVYWPAGHMQRS